MHVAHINFLRSPEGLAPEEVFKRWPSLADIPEAAASSGTAISFIQAAAYATRIVRNGIEYHFTDVASMDTVAVRARCFSKRLCEIKADILHVHGLGFAHDAFAVAQYLPQMPIIFQDHADHPPPWWRRRQWRNWYASASGVTFTAQDLARPFVAAGLFGPQTRLFAIPESSSRFTLGNRAIARHETGLYGDPCVLWVGHLNAGKDPLTVLDGIAQAVLQLPNLQLWCVFHDAPLLAEVRQRIERDPHLSGRVHLLGKVGHAHIQSLMRAADIYVSGSRHESCGYALLEALACGVTPVVTDIPSFRALTNDSGIGRLWPSGDARRLADALVCVAPSLPSRERVRAHFDSALSFAALGRRWSQAYRQVFDENRRRTT